MKIEEIGFCPCCFNDKKNGAVINFYALREDNGELKEIHIFGDDDFDVPSANQTVTEASFSNDGKFVTEVVCPRCKEHIEVKIPIVKQQSEIFKHLEKYAKPLKVASKVATEKTAN